MKPPYFVTFIALLAPMLLPSIARAQSTSSGAVAGVVTDASGAVIPGVTVEAASPALIEKVRSVVTDDQGQYKIVDLRPGTYTVSFSLSGFAAVKREGLVLTTGFTATVNAEMRLGSLEETVTVAGASPLVDTQNVRTQTVFSRDGLDALPSAKTLQGYAALTLGATFTSAADQDVGGNRGEMGGLGAFTVHNSRASDSRVTMDGMPFGQLTGDQNASSRGQFVNQLAVEETSIQTSGFSAEFEVAGPTANIVPKDGGNTFKFTVAGNGTGSGLQSSNLTDELRGRGLITPPKVKHIYDVGFAGGGPVQTDRLWFYTAHRWWGTQNTAPGNYFNATQHTLFYTADLSRPAYLDFPHWDSSVRFTWQVSTRNKITISESLQHSCGCFTRSDLGTYAPEATYSFIYYPNSITQGTWSYPATNRLLFEAGATVLWQNQDNVRQDDVFTDDISVLELSTGYQYNANQPPSTIAASGLAISSTYGEGSRSHQSNQRFSMSYVTGSHAFKVGFFMMEGWGFSHFEVNETPYGPISYQFRLGVPSSITQYSSPQDVRYRLMPDLGIYVQDQWTRRKLTFNMGVRFDHVRAYAPAQREEGNAFVGPREFSEADNIPLFNDISPRLGVAYDVFGNGRTAIKGSFGGFVGSEGARLSQLNAPAARIAGAATRTWADTNRDYVPNCELRNFQANGECGTLSNLNLGQTVPSTNYAEDVLRGFGRRAYMWQGSVSVQQELRPGLALNVGYFHTRHANLTTTANQAVAPGDFDEYCVTAPVDSRLGASSGETLCGLYDVTPNRFGQVSNLVQPSENFGEQTDSYDGIDVAVNARFGRGGLLSGGFSAGQTVTDNCDVVRGNPQIALTVGGATASRSSTDFCRVTLPWSAQTQVKFAANYPLPWWGLQASGMFQNLAGIPYFANRVFTNAEIAPSLGRNLAAGPNGTVNVQLLVPNTEFEDRLNQFDFRLTKTVTIGESPAAGQVRCLQRVQCEHRTERSIHIRTELAETVCNSRCALVQIRSPGRFLVCGVMKSSIMSEHWDDARWWPRPDCAKMFGRHARQSVKPIGGIPCEIDSVERQPVVRLRSPAWRAPPPHRLRPRSAASSRSRPTSPSRWKSPSTVPPPRCGSASGSGAMSANGCRFRPDARSSRERTGKSAPSARWAMRSSWASPNFHTRTRRRCGPTGVYNLYHGTLEVRPLTATTSKIFYTLVLDNSMLPDDAAREKDKATRAAMFTRALGNMKTLAEGGTLPPPPARGGPPPAGAPTQR